MAQRERITYENVFITCRRTDGVLCGTTVMRFKEGDLRVIMLRYDAGELVGRWSAVTNTHIIHGYITGEPPAFAFTTRRCDGKRSLAAYFLTDGALHIFAMGGDQADTDALITRCHLPVDQPDSTLIALAISVMEPSRLLQASLLQTILDEVGLSEWFVAPGCTENIGCEN